MKIHQSQYDFLLPNLPLRSSQETVTSRKEICNSCELFKKSIQICGDCKCFMPIKWVIKKSECPIEKW